MKFCYMQKRQIMYGFTYMRNIKNKKAKVPDRTDKWLLEVRGGKGRGVKWVKGGQRVQTSRYKINKSWGWNVQHDYYIIMLIILLIILC